MKKDKRAKRAKKKAKQANTNKQKALSNKHTGGVDNFGLFSSSNEMMVGVMDDDKNIIETIYTDGLSDFLQVIRSYQSEGLVDLYEHKDTPIDGYDAMFVRTKDIINKSIEDEKRYIDEAQHELNLRHPKEEFKFCAFVIKIPESDEFLANRISKNGVSRYEWIKGIPEKAKRFTNLKMVERIAIEIGKGARAEMLFDGNTSFISVCDEERDG